MPVYCFGYAVKRPPFGILSMLEVIFGDIFEAKEAPKVNGLFSA